MVKILVTIFRQLQFDHFDRLNATDILRDYYFDFYNNNKMCRNDFLFSHLYRLVFLELTVDLNPR